jgi:hypothetical protein
MKTLKIALTCALLLSALATASLADPWFQEYRPVAGGDGNWLISPGDAGETIAFQARVYEGYQDPVDTNMLMSASCTITFNSDQVACGGLSTLTVDAVDTSVPSDGWWTFEIDQPMSLHVDADGDLDIVVAITFLEETPFGTYPATDQQNYEAVVFCPDYNADLIVNLSDLGLFSTAYSAQDPNYDLNGDGVLNLSDTGLFSSAFGDACDGDKSGMTEAEAFEYIKAQLGQEDSSWSAMKALYR